MTKTYIATVSMLMTLYLAGCSTTHQETLTEDFGNATRTNTAMQIINPEAGQEDLPPMALDGKKAEKVLESYQKESGKAPTERLVTEIGQ